MGNGQFQPDSPERVGLPRRPTFAGSYGPATPRPPERSTAGTAGPDRNDPASAEPHLESIPDTG